MIFKKKKREIYEYSFIHNIFALFDTVRYGFYILFFTYQNMYFVAL